MKYISLIYVSLFLITSCEMNNDSNEIYPTADRPDTPLDDSIDINSDNVVDFVLCYMELATTDEPSSSGSIIGSINPINENQILYRNLEGCLFLEKNDTIRKNDNTNSHWSDYKADIIEISRQHNNIWDTNWTILSNHESDYYLGFKLKIVSTEEIGWMLLNFDIESGITKILSKEITNIDELIIN